MYYWKKKAKCMWRISFDKLLSWVLRYQWSPTGWRGQDYFWWWVDCMDLLGIMLERPLSTDWIALKKNFGITIIALYDHMFEMEGDLLTKHYECIECQHKNIVDIILIENVTKHYIFDQWLTIWYKKIICRVFLCHSPLSLLPLLMLTSEGTNHLSTQTLGNKKIADAYNKGISKMSHGLWIYCDERG